MSMYLPGLRALSAGPLSVSTLPSARLNSTDLATTCSSSCIMRSSSAPARSDNVLVGAAAGACVGALLVWQRAGKSGALSTPICAAAKPRRPRRRASCRFAAHLIRQRRDRLCEARDWRVGDAGADLPDAGGAVRDA